MTSIKNLQLTQEPIAKAEMLIRKPVAQVFEGRMGSPEEVVKAVSFLALDDSNFVTGIELFVDWGQAQI